MKLDGSIEGRPFIKDVIVLVVIGVFYYLAHQIAFIFPDANKVLMAVWPAGGIGLAALILNPPRLWPAIIAVLFVSGNAANIVAGRPLVNSIGFMTANVLESFISAFLITGWCGDKVRFNRKKEIYSLIFCASIVNACTAMIGAGTASLTHIASFQDFWLSWVISDGLGILIITPLIVSWSGIRINSKITKKYQYFEGVIFFFLWVLTALFVFQTHLNEKIYRIHPQPYLLIILITWGALRLGQKGVTIALTAASIITLTSDSVIYGPLLWGGETLADRLILVQLFIAVMAVSGYLIAAIYYEIKEVEKKALEDQTRIRTIGNNLPGGVIYQLIREMDESMRFLYMSSGIEQLIGISADQIMNDSAALFDKVFEEDRHVFVFQGLESIKNLSRLSIAIRFKNENNGLKWIHLSSTPRLLSDKRIVWDGIMLDITERKESELKVILSEEQLKKAQVVAHLGSWKWFINENRLEWSDEMYRIFGIDKSSFVGNIADAMLQCIHPEDVPLVEESNKSVIYGGKSYPLEFRIIWPDYSTRYIWAEAGELVLDPEGKPAILTGIAQDITERRTAEKSLIENEKRFHGLYEGMMDAYARVDIFGKLVEYNLSFKNMLGYTDEELLRLTYKELTPEKWWDLEAKLIETQVLVRGYSDIFEKEYRRKDGSIISVELRTNLIRNENGNPQGMWAIVRDITERKRIKEALQNSEEKYRQLFENMQVGFALHRIVTDDKGKPIDYVYADVNQAFEEQTGMKKEEIIGKPVTELLPGIENDPAGWIGQYGHVALTGESTAFESYSEQLGKWYSVNAYSPKKDYFATLSIDITHKKEAEEELHRWSHIFEYSGWGILITSPDGRKMKTMNPAFSKMHGYALEELIGKDAEILFPENNREKLDAYIKDDQAEGHNKRETCHVRKNGVVFPVMIDATVVRDEYGVILYRVINVLDVTEQKRAEAELRNSEEKYRALFNNAESGMFRSRLDGSEIIDMNEKYLEIFGYSREEMQGRQSVIHWADLHEREDMVKRLEAEGRVADFECRMVTKNGDVITCLASIKLFPETGILEGSIIDITARKKAEEELRRWSHIFEYSGWGINVGSPDGGTIISMNPAFAKMHGYTVEELTGRPTSILFPEEYHESLRKQIKIAHQKGHHSLESCHIRKDGTVFPVMIDVTVVRDEYGVIQYMVVNVLDITERKKSEDIIRISEEKYRALFNNAESGMFRSRLDGSEILDVNDKYLEIMGYERGELLGGKSTILWDDLQQRKEMVKHLKAEGRVTDFESRMVTKQGKVIICLTSVKLFPDGIIEGSLIDITARKKAELELQKSEEKYRALFNNAETGMFRSRVDGSEVLDINDKFLEIFGYQREEIQGKMPEKLWADLEQRKESVRLLNLYGKVKDFESRMLTKKGEEITCVTSLRLFPDGILEGSFIDITSRKKVEEELRKLSQAVEQSPATIVITDTEGIIEYVNPKFTELTGYQPSEVIGQNPRILKTGYTTKIEYSQLWETIKAGNTWRGEFCNRKKNGSLYWEMASISAVQDEKKKITHFLAVKEDITDRKQAENHLIELHLSLERANEDIRRKDNMLLRSERLSSLGQLSSAVAHEVRQPLNNIKLISDGILFWKDEHMDISIDEIYKGLGDISRNVDRMDKTLKTMLNMVKSPEKIEYKQLNLNQLVMDSLTVIEQKLKDHSIELQLKLDPNIQPMELSEIQIQQVILNIVSNAIKILDASNPGYKKILIETLENKDKVVLRFSDNGPGVSNENKERIFNPFFSTHQTQEDVGLGLYIVHAIVKSYGAEIYVKDNEWGGATFVIRFNRRSEV